MPSTHPLDRPVWSALTTRQSDLAIGDGAVLRFDPDYGPFAATADGSADGLTPLIPADGTIWVVEPEEVAPPVGAKVVRVARLGQMVAEAITPADRSIDFLPLTEADALEMRALALLTEPGPFHVRTHRLGDFIGIKQDGKLVAMAGERMRPDGFTEVSGVCTHPDHRGHGYASGLMRVVAERILARGEAPFLHVYASNSGAIALYESLGFRHRLANVVTILARA